MTFFNRQVSVSAGATAEVLKIPKGVKIDSLILRVTGGTSYVSVHSSAANTGMILYDGERLEFSEGDLHSNRTGEQFIFVYSASAVVVYLMGVIDNTDVEMITNEN